MSGNGLFGRIGAGISATVKGAKEKFDEAGGVEGIAAKVGERVDQGLKEAGVEGGLAEVKTKGAEAWAKGEEALKRGDEIAGKAVDRGVAAVKGAAEGLRGPKDPAP